MTRRAKALLVTNVVLFAAFLVLSLWTAIGIDWAAVALAMEGASLAYVLAMVASWFVVLLVRPVRLQVLINAMSPGGACRYGAVWSATMVGMGLNTLIPLRAGDVATVLILRQSLHVRGAHAFSALIVDRFFDFATVIVLFVAALSVAPIAPAWTIGLVPSMLLALLCLVTGLGSLVRFRATWLRLIRAVLWRVAPTKNQWAEKAQELFSGFAHIEKAAVLAQVIALSILIWSITTLNYWFGTVATWPSASLAAAAFTASTAALVFVVPLTPAGLGVFHGACVLALAVFGVPFEPALAFAIAAHALQVSSVLVLAAIVFLSKRLSLRALATPADDRLAAELIDRKP